MVNWYEIASINYVLQEKSYASHSTDFFVFNVLDGCGMEWFKTYKKYIETSIIYTKNTTGY